MWKEERFWNKVRKADDDDCWEWTGSKRVDGYGQCWKDEVLQKAHRVMWELTHGKIPDGFVVRHKCRNKCVNPNHLELGTHTDNMRDKIRDGTASRMKGEKHPMAKLNEKQVQEIRKQLEDYKYGLLSKLAREYNITPQMISLIWKNKSWN